MTERDGAQIFTNVCRRIWPVPEWRHKAATFLDVRFSTVEQWGRGRRTYPPAVLEKLAQLARGRAELLQQAAAEAADFIKDQAA